MVSRETECSGTLRSIHDVCRLTGIEASRVRFIETEFSEYFGGPDKGMQHTGFDDRGIEMLRKIHHLIFQQGATPFAVRKELKRSMHRFRTLAVTSGKGGVGKTTISLNLAIAAAQSGQRTLLLDADMGLGNVHVFAGIAPRGTMMDLVEGRRPAAELLSPGPGGIQVLCGSSGSTRLADLSPRAIERLGGELAEMGNEFDQMIIDTGAGISAQVTEFLAMADDILVVTTPNIAATLDAYGVIKVAREEGMRGRIHILVNQADSEPQAAQVAEKIRACAQRFLDYAPEILGGLTRDAAVEEANQTRRPLLISRPGDPNAAAIARIAARLCAPENQARPEERAA